MKPMLAETPEDLERDLKHHYPFLASPKLDGIRCVIPDGLPLTRTLERVPNKYINRTLTDLKLLKLDGELMKPGAKFNEVTSMVMGENSPAEDFVYYVFDCFEDMAEPYAARLKRATDYVEALNSPHVKMVLHVPVANHAELCAFEEKCLDLGFEGAMVNKPTAPYKQGRSTVNQAYLLKVIRWTRAEAEILGFEELEANHNAATTDKLGRTKRSSAQAGKVKLGALGNLQVKLVTDGLPFPVGTEFGIGGGFDAKQRKDLWSVKETLPGKTVTFKFKPAGSIYKPRFPQFVGLRDPRDMS